MLVLTWFFAGFLLGLIFAIVGISWRQLFEDPRLEAQIEEMRQLRLQHHRAVFKNKMLRLIIRNYGKQVNIDPEPIAKVIREYEDEKRRQKNEARTL